MFKKRFSCYWKENKRSFVNNRWLVCFADFLWSLNLKCVYLFVRSSKIYTIIHFCDQHSKLYLFHCVPSSLKELYFFPLLTWVSFSGNLRAEGFLFQLISLDNENNCLWRYSSLSDTYEIVCTLYYVTSLFYSGI